MHRRRWDRRGVAKAVGRALRDLAQDPPHDLARAGLRQCRREVDLFGRGHAANVVSHFLHELLAKGVTAFLAGVQGDEGVDGGALDLVRKADDRGFGDLRMAD